jgi:hypothetical protein
MANTRKRFHAQISVPVTQKMYDELNRIALQKQITVSQITRDYLEKALFEDKETKAD